MFYSVRRRLLLINVLVVLLVTATFGLILTATQPAVHYWRTMLNVAPIALIVTILLTAVATAPIAAAITGVRSMLERLAAGELHARNLPVGSDEVGRLTRIANSVAEQMQAQEATRIQEQERLQVVLENVADGVLILDDAGRVLRINPAAQRLLQMPAQNAVGRSFAQVVLNHSLIRMWQLCREQGQEVADLVEISPQGLSIRAVIMPCHPRQPRDYVVLFQDLTQLRRLELARQDFVSNISHELRTPLASLRALVDTLGEGAMDDPAAAPRFLNRIDTEVDAMTQMVQELLELSRIDSGRVPFRFKPMHVADIVLPTVERLQVQAERAHVSLVLDLPGGLPSILVDGERIQQVVTNLVHNAVKFTGAGGTVTLRAHTVDELGEVALPGALPAQPQGPMVVVEVWDTGVGIPKRDLSRIFERFYKADRARTGGGTGLGLAIAKHIVLAHGGQIWASSTEGKGSLFSFTVPVAMIQEAEGREAKP